MSNLETSRLFARCTGSREISLLIDIIQEMNFALPDYILTAEISNDGTRAVVHFTRGSFCLLLCFGWITQLLCPFAKWKCYITLQHDGVHYEEATLCFTRSTWFIIFCSYLFGGICGAIFLSMEFIRVRRIAVKCLQDSARFHRYCALLNNHHHHLGALSSSPPPPESPAAAEAQDIQRGGGGGSSSVQIARPLCFIDATCQKNIMRGFNDGAFLSGRAPTFTVETLRRNQVEPNAPAFDESAEV
jgi:hypothetical protein